MNFALFPLAFPFRRRFSAACEEAAGSPRVPDHESGYSARCQEPQQPAILNRTTVVDDVSVLSARPATTNRPTTPTRITPGIYHLVS